jgi:alanine racemase
MDTTLPRAISKEAVKQNKILKVHLKIDTGMSRVGAKPEDALKIAKEVLTMAKYRDRSDSLTHMPSADGQDKEFLLHYQLDLFHKVINNCKIMEFYIPLNNMANSVVY